MTVAMPAELTAFLVPARKLERQEKRGCISTGLTGLDDVLGGGWPRGTLSELAGPRSCGRTSLVLGSLAAALTRGEAAALVDVGGGLDARAAARRGLPLEQLLWVRCAPEKLLPAADLIASAGGFGLVVLEFGDVWPSVPTAAWQRLKRTAAAHGAAVIASAPRRPQGALGRCALKLENHAPYFQGGHQDGRQGGHDVQPALLLGLRVSARIERNQGAHTENSTMFVELVRPADAHP